MATSPEAIRAELAVVTTAAATDLADLGTPTEMLKALNLVVPSYYDAAAALAVAWYDEIRAESTPLTVFEPQIIGVGTTDWIEREVAEFAKALDSEIDDATERLTAELIALVEKEVARGFRDTTAGNALDDVDAIGWSRIARPGACKLCVMAADRGAVYKKQTANFAAHTNCHCAARAEFLGGVHGPEATVEQYLAAKKRRTPKERAALRAYLNENYPDNRG